jgi:hypothetical protein
MKTLEPAELYPTNEILGIVNEDPLESAEFFKSTSDRIWQNDFATKQPDFAHLDSVLSPIEVVDGINATVGNFDERFVIASVGKSLLLGPDRTHDSTISYSSGYFDTPTSTGIECNNWDARSNFRIIQYGGRERAVRFLNGHEDYHRQLGIRLAFGNNTRLLYSMRRNEAQQDSEVDLTLKLQSRVIPGLARAGQLIVRALMPEHAEIDFLDLINKMAGEN